MDRRWPWIFVLCTVCGCDRSPRGPDPVTPIHTSASPGASAPAPVPSSSPDSPTSRFFSLAEADVRTAEVTAPIDPATAGLPLYPEATLIKARQVRLTLKDGRVYRHIEVCLSTGDGLDTVDTWYRQQGYPLYERHAASTDYRIWLDTKHDTTLITLLRYYHD